MKKIINKSLLALIAGLIALSVSGCTAIGGITGHNFNNPDIKLSLSVTEFSKEQKVIMTEDKSYVVLVNELRTNSVVLRKEEFFENLKNEGTALYEVIDGKIILAGYLNEIPGTAIIEVVPGKHTYVGTSDCYPFTITIDVEKGKAYYLKYRGSIKTSWKEHYCRSQNAFEYLPYETPNRSYMFLKNYTLVPENIEYANDIINISSLPGEYEDFLEDIQDMDDRLHIEVEGSEGSIF